MTDAPTERVEAQLYPDQIAALRAHCSRIVSANKREVPRSERRRLTTNSLLRVATTILLEHPDALVGRNEPEILENVRRSLIERYGK